MAQRLERDSARLAIMVATKAERMVCATHRQHRGARRKSLVKYIDLRTIVASELKCEQREQHRFAGAGRSDAQHMADVADVRAEPKRCRAAGLGVEQWRSVEVRVAPWSRTYRRQRHPMGQVQAMKQWLPDIRITLDG